VAKSRKQKRGKRGEQEPQKNQAFFQNSQEFRGMNISDYRVVCVGRLSIHYEKLMLNGVVSTKHVPGVEN